MLATPTTPIQTKEEALAILTTTRKGFIAVARAVAERLIKRNGSTHARAVYNEMVATGWHCNQIDARWLGAVFYRSKFEPTGDWYWPTEADYATTPGATHVGHPLRVWRLK